MSINIILTYSEKDLNLKRHKKHMSSLSTPHTLTWKSLSLFCKMYALSWENNMTQAKGFFLHKKKLVYLQR